MTCLTRREIEDMLRSIRKTAEINFGQDKRTRLKVWDISGQAVLDMLKSFTTSSIEKASTDGIASHIKIKLKRALRSIKPRFRPAMGEFITALKQNAPKGIKSEEGKAKAVRDQAIALKEIFAAFEGEINKGDELGIEHSEFFNEGLPNIPLHRLAATIGRKMMYLSGNRFKKRSEGHVSNAEAVERGYYLAGMSAITQLVNGGFLRVNEKGMGNFTIRDFLENNIHNDRNYKELLIDTVPTVELNMKAFGIETSKDVAIKYFTNKAQSDIQNHQLNAYVQTVEAINLISQPQTIVLPHQEKVNGKRVNKDAYQVDGDLATARTALESHPHKMNRTIHDFFGAIGHELRNSSETASQYIRRTVSDSKSLKQLFGIDKFNMIASNEASHNGKNLSKTVPIDDYVDYFNELSNEDGSPANMFMALFAGRNVRLYNENTVVNTQSSKLMRNAIETDPYTVKVDYKDPSYIYHVQKVAHRFGFQNDITTQGEHSLLNAMVDHAGTTEVGALLKEGFTQLEAFQKAEGAIEKVRVLGKLTSLFPGMNFTDIIVSLEAAKKIMDTPEGKSFETTFMGESDATAYGAQTILKQAIGTEPKKLTKILQQMGLFKGKPEDVKNIDDIYGILKEHLDIFMHPEKDPEGVIGIWNPKDEGKDQQRSTLKLITDVLYPGEKGLRELSKPTTMQFVYQQSKGGGVAEISKVFQELLTDALNHPLKEVSPKVIKLANLILGTEHEHNQKGLSALQDSLSLRNGLRKGFKDTEIPALIFDTLDLALTQQILSQYQIRHDNISKLIQDFPGLNDMRMYPAALVVEAAIAGKKLPYTKSDLKKRGVTLSKVFEVSHDIGDDTILTREEKFQSTVLATSMVHGIDTNNSHIATLDRITKQPLTEKHNTGIFLIHDQIWSNTHALREMEGNFTHQDKMVAMHYDIHEQALLAARAWLDTPKEKIDLNGEPDYTNLLEQVKAEKLIKQQTVEKYFDDQTHNVIGDEAPPSSISNPSGTKSRTPDVTKSEQKNQTEPTKPKPKTFKNQTADEILTDLSQDSELIQGFIDSPNSASIRKADPGEVSSFSNTNDQIIISNTDTRVENNPVRQLSSNKGRKAIQQLVEHEIVHSYTSALISAWAWSRSQGRHTDRNIDYIHNTVGTLRSLVERNKFVGNKTTQERLNYVLSQTNDASVLSEFISIMSTEPEVAAQIYKNIDSNKTRVKRIVDAVIKKVKALIVSINKTDIDKFEPNAEKLFGALNNVVNQGKSNREVRLEAHRKMQAGFGESFAGPHSPSYNANTWREPDYVFSSPVEYLNNAVARNINDPLINKGLNSADAINTYLETTFKTYKDASDLIKGAAKPIIESKHYKQIIHSVTNNNVNADFKNEKLSLFTAVRNEKNAVVSKELEKFANLKLTENENKDLKDFTQKMAMQDYFMYAEDIQDIPTQITVLEKQMSASQIRDIKSIVDMNVHDQVDRNTVYNVKLMHRSSGVEQDRIRQLLVLKSIEALGINRFENFKQNTALMTQLKDNVLANAMLTKDGYIRNRDIRDSQIMDYYKEPKTFKVFSHKDTNFFADTEKNGWTIVKPPTKNNAGVAYQTIIDSTFQEGIGTDLRMNSGDINVGAEFKNDPRVVKSGTGYKYILEQKHKKTAGIIQDGSQGVVRTLGQSFALAHSAKIHNDILESTSYWDVSKKDIAGLDDLLRDKNAEYPWFIGGNKELTYDKLPDRVKAEYMPVPKKLSDIGGDNSLENKVDYVRKATAYWTVGASDKSIARDPKLQWAVRIAKDIITGAKIGQVITNPVKIYKDNMWNVRYLMVNDVNPLFIQKQYRNISAEWNNYQKIKEEKIQLLTKSYAFPNDQKIQNRMNHLNDLLNRHPAKGIEERGFSNSLGSHIVLNASDPSSGFSKDLDTVFTAMFKDKNKQNTALAKKILSFAKFGVSTEDFLETFAIGFKGADSTALLGEELNRAAARLRNIKSQDDIVNYLHQYLNSPNSEFVKLGAQMTDLTDVLAKETLYRHHLAKGLDPKAAERSVIAAFPDYKENMPTLIKKFSDVGILMYPSWWVRVQRALINLAHNKPVSLGADIAISHYAESTASSVWSPFIYNKATQFNGILNNPFDLFNINALYTPRLY